VAVPIQLILAPYDSGHESVRMGLGPQRLLPEIEAGLRAAGYELDVERVTVQGFMAEIATSFAVSRAVAARVHAARRSGRWPLLLSGNCGAALGSIGGLGGAGLGLVWLDGHGDFNTPETSVTGFLDGMALAAATGRCWRGLLASIRGFHPIEDDAVVHVGGRDFEEDEIGLLNDSRIAVVDAPRIRRQGLETVLLPPLDALARRRRRVYVHIDLDVLDPTTMPANHLAAAGGLSLDEALRTLREISARFDVEGAGLAAYDPSCDPKGETARAGAALIGALVSRASTIGRS
jgi:arginase